MNDFERELEDELHRILDPMTAASIPARRVAESGGIMKKLLGGAGAAIGVKLLTGLAVAAAAATVAVAATEVATTGSLDPTNWGQRVTQQVSDCKASAARLGVHGIGQCVASLARTHGDTVSDSHGHGQNNNAGHGNGNSNGNGNSKNKNHGNGSDRGQTPTTSTTSTTSTDAEPTDPVLEVHTGITPPR